MLKDTIAAAQRNDEESLLALIEKFKPLLKKYAYKLHYEDSFFDLQLDFIQIVTTLNLEAQTKESEGALVNYICNSVQHAYCKRLKYILDRSVSTTEIDSLTTVSYTHLRVLYDRVGYRLHELRLGVQTVQAVPAVRVFHVQKVHSFHIEAMLTEIRRKTFKKFALGIRDECGLAALRAAHEERDDKASGFAAARRADAE